MASHDPIQTEIHRKAIENIVNEMALTLVRTSGSPIVTDAKDFSTCLLDEHGEQIGLSCYVLLHSATAWLNTRAVIDQLALDGGQARPGDGWIVNDPYSAGAQHQGDVAIVMPTFYRDEHVGWAFSNLHVLDIGGMGVSGIAPTAVTVFDEALRFGPTRIITGGRIDEEWKRYLVQNVRTPVPVLNDIRSMIAANNVAEAKLSDVLDRYGLEAHREHNERNKVLTEQLLRRRVEAMPDGRYEAVEYIEFDAHGPDELIEVRCTLTVEGSDLRFAYTGDPQVQAPVNGTKGTVYAGVMGHVMTMLGYGDLPFNAGIWRALTIDIGEPGTIVNALPPAPVSMGHAEAGSRVGKAARNVLNQAASLSSDPVLRSRAGGIASEAAAVAFMFGLDEAGSPALLAYLETLQGTGGGAQPDADGQDMYGWPSTSGAGMPDVELHEATDPVLFLWRRITQNSGGPGQRRGGQGVDQAYVLLGSSTFQGFANMGCADVPPPGFGGGLPPSTSLHFPVRGGLEGGLAGRHVLDATALAGTRETIRKKVGHFVFNPGDVMHAICGGGGGLGDPLLRDPDLVAKDLVDGYITPEHATVAYGVVLDAGGTIDAGATQRRRAELRSARLGAVPERDAAAPEVPGIAVILGEGAGGACWTCASCAAELAPLHEDWRRHTVAHEVPIAEFFAALQMQVRAREVAPHISVVCHYCPSCASCLTTDVTSDRFVPRSPVLAAAPVAVPG